jgi:hypothetical protein
MSAAPVRVAFAGPPAALEGRVPVAPAHGLVPLVATDGPRQAGAIERFAPHVVVAFGAERPPAPSGVPVIAVREHGAVAGGADRVVSFEAGGDGVWRRLPPPVDDRLFALPRGGARPAFFGATTDRRERLLLSSKHQHDLLHVDSGAGVERRRALDATIAVGVNVHAGDEPAFEHTAAAHLAAGHLLISEPLAPLHGLEPGVDFLLAESADDFVELIGSALRTPGAHPRVRACGRAKAEAFRASRVWARVVEDLRRDLRAFG